MGEVARSLIIDAFGASRNLAPIDASLLNLERCLSLDLRLTRRIVIGGRRHLDLFSKAYNVTNHVNFNPNVRRTWCRRRSRRAPGPAIRGTLSGG